MLPQEGWLQEPSERSHWPRGCLLPWFAIKPHLGLTFSSLWAFLENQPGFYLLSDPLLCFFPFPLSCFLPKDRNLIFYARLFLRRSAHLLGPSYYQLPR